MLPSDSHSHSVSPRKTTMSKPQTRPKPLSILTDTFLFFSGALSAFLLVWGFWSFLNPNSTPDFSSAIPKSPFTLYSPPSAHSPNLRYNSQSPSFYDDPNLSYSIDHTIQNWDIKRIQWLQQHPSFASGVQDRIFMLTGSQPSACSNPIGDHLLLRFYKNKADYCRIHGYDLFYNNAHLHPKMDSYWAKLPVVRASMIAHPEAEWIWWVDSDAAFTDMEFKLPLDKYRDYNLVVHGWPNLVYEDKSWVSLNAGVFLIRNCQWSLDFMDVWAQMGPQTPEYEHWGEIQRATFKDKEFPKSDDQSGLVYLLLKEKEKWGNKIFLENEYYFEGYWDDIVGTFSNISEKYVEIEKGARELRRRHAEKVSERFGEVRESYLKDLGIGRGGLRRPFITHFTGCQPCSGNYNGRYTAESCWNGMQTALNFADNQVLRSFGYMRTDFLDPKSLSQVPFDYPA